MKNKNQIDILIEDLAGRFSGITNFHLLQETEEGKKLFDFVIKTTSDLENLQTLFLNYYIPAANKSIIDTWNQINKSQYKKLLNITKDDLKENLYETIRLGYVGLFHKYESFLKSLVSASDYLFKELREENNLLTIENYCKKEFQVNIFKSHDKFSITSRINYISNSVKHWDGFLKIPVHEDFKDLDQNSKIEISKEILKIDIDKLKTHCQLITSQIIIMGFKQYVELDYAIIQRSLKPELVNDLETKIKFDEMKINFDYVLSDFK